MPESPKKKQKVEGGSSKHSSPTRGRFKAMGHLMIAMRRFQASLNPTVTFGKPVGSNAPPTPQAPVLQQAKSRTRSGGEQRTLSGRPIGPPGKQHGHKGYLLVRPLPKVEEVKN